MQLNLKSFLDLIPAEIILSTQNLTLNNDECISSVIIDTRDLKNLTNPRAVFFAFEGGVVDGHAYIKAAIDQGVVLVVGTKSIEQIAEITAITDAEFLHIPYIQVSDSLTVLQKIAKTYREQYLREVHIVGITGSVGKTTTKDLLATACEKMLLTTPSLKQDNTPDSPGEILVRTTPPLIYATKGNLNNHIGVPLSILAINPGQKIAILEAGMNHRGEIKILAEIMQPDSVIITKIGVAHIEYLGTQEEIAREKSDLAIYSSRVTKVYIPIDDTFALFVQSYIQEKTSDKTEVVLVDTLVSTLLSHTPKHIADNISLVVACAKHLATQLAVPQKLDTDNIDNTDNIDPVSDEILIKTVLQSHITPRRFEIKKISNNLLLIDDSYNANPDSMKASLKAFNDLDLSQYFEQDTLIAPQKIAVLGGMAELGTQSEIMHQEISHYIDTLSNIDIALSVGDLAKQYGFAHNLMHLIDIQSAVHTLQEKIIQTPSPLAIFIKGSKSTHMSDLVDQIL